MNFLFEIEPVAKGRPRFTRAGIAYTPTKTRSFEKELKALAQEEMEKHGWEMIKEKPVDLWIIFFSPIPKSYSKKERGACLNGEMFPAKKPDIDNLVKGVSDALNGVVWEDDKQICRLVSVKQYCTKKIPNPCIVVSVAELIDLEKSPDFWE